ncbi:MAG TPA: bifunctional phosphopantothenoylcysteine decarboxylase/phosphopantothenate--cysteine ligase CoaBC [Acidobacteriaceae bacterium]|jgi:phosphopantothenoylcysteine decarboxylase/phosphopantothenate--cysteine ligase
MKVLVGVCGGIAAYKAAELVRLLQAGGLDVEVAMTANAERFITPLTFAALTGHTVYTSLWQPSGEQGANAGSGFQIEHIAVVGDIDALVIAPATANMLAKLAHGIADDFLSTAYLAAQVPVIVAPAMNVHMWQHPATRANVRILEERGVHFIAPDEGYLACGMTGSGRLASVESIATEVLAVLDTRHDANTKDFAGETVLVTAGGTREPIDPVRFIGNRSSGRMGYALAEEALARGANVILITAATTAAPAGCTTVQVSTAADMASEVFARIGDATVVIQAAAVSDYRVRNVSASKLKRNGTLTLELEPTEDIAAGIAARKREETLLIAFAAETENLEANARTKLLRKGADAIVANDVSLPGLGFDSDRNAGLFLTAAQTIPLSESSKRVMARRILDEIATLRRQRSSIPQFAGEPSAFD